MSQKFSASLRNSFWYQKCPAVFKLPKPDNAFGQQGARIFYFARSLPRPRRNVLYIQSRLTQVRFCSADFRSNMAASDRDILPDTVKPLNYDLSLFNLEFGGSWGYDGLVKIDAHVSPTKEVVLNTKELEITSAYVLSNGEKVASMTGVSEDTTNERATITLDNELPLGDAVIAIEFKGTMNSTMAGFYRSKYKPTVTPVRFLAFSKRWP
jgi:hypothetical protein